MNHRSKTNYRSKNRESFETQNNNRQQQPTRRKKQLREQLNTRTTQHITKMTMLSTLRKATFVGGLIFQTNMGGVEGLMLRPPAADDQDLQPLSENNSTRLMHNPPMESGINHFIY